MNANRLAATIAVFDAVMATLQAAFGFYFIIIGNGPMTAFCAGMSALFVVWGLSWLRRVEP